MIKKLTMLLAALLLICLPMNLMGSELLDCIHEANEAFNDCAYGTLSATIGGALAGAALGALRLNVASIGIGACAGIISAIASRWPECETQYLQSTEYCYANYPLIT